MFRAQAVLKGDGVEYFFAALHSYADFSGRTTRQEYWMFVLYYTIIFVALLVASLLIRILVLMLPVFLLALLIPNISITTRRLHDIGLSGWWQLVPVVPMLGTIVLLVLLVQDSHDENIYGPRPWHA